MTADEPLPSLPLDDLPDGTVKVPLNLPSGAAWPVVTQIAALSQRTQGCTASTGYLAERLGLARETIARTLTEASPWIVTAKKGSRRVLRLAPIADSTPWARLSYRAAAGVGCRSVDGTWRPRRNRSALLELYAHLRHDEMTGVHRTAVQLARALDVTDRTVRNLVVTLEEDGWIVPCRKGGRTVHLTREDALRLVPQDDALEPETEVTSNGNRGHTDPETEVTQKQELEARTLKQDLSLPAVGDLQGRKRASGGGALPRGTDETSSDEEDPGTVSGLDISRIYGSLPDELRQAIPGHGMRRVRSAIRAQLAAGSRSVDELAARVSRRWVGGEWAGQRIDDPTAVAITLVRLGRPCGNVRCEGGADLDTGQKCRACSGSRQVWGSSGSGVVSAGEASSSLAPPPVRSVLDVQGASTGPNEEFLAERARMRGGRSSA
ncbi:hypothetical protein ACOZ38_25670 [Sphaerisporangium viridialbum]|uniref:hypothetical protein n=1 Tax=Sphaerisporangium viridialbum TaxID=46189 RepID=UPI003C76F0FC